MKKLISLLLVTACAFVAMGANEPLWIGTQWVWIDGELNDGSSEKTPWISESNGGNTIIASIGKSKNFVANVPTNHQIKCWAFWNASKALQVNNNGCDDDHIIETEDTACMVSWSGASAVTITAGGIAKSDPDKLETTATGGYLHYYLGVEFEWLKYTIKFDGNGASSGSMDSMEDNVYNVGSELTANGFSRTGYNFAGWKQKNLKTASLIADGATVTGDNFSGLSYKNKSVTLVAQWTPNSYTINFYADGGDEVASIDAIYDQEYKAPSTTRAGYTFKGWATEKGSDTVSYKSDAMLFNLSNTAGGVENLFAVWEPKTYTITVKSGIGGDGGGTSSYTVSETKQMISFDTIAPTRTGYHFDTASVSIKSAAEFGGDLPTVSGTANIIPANTYGEFIITPNWVVNEYNISYTLPEGMVSENKTISHHGDILVVKTPTLATDKAFVGWTVSGGVNSEVEYSIDEGVTWNKIIDWDNAVGANSDEVWFRNLCSDHGGAVTLTLNQKQTYNVEVEAEKVEIAGSGTFKQYGTTTGSGVYALDSLVPIAATPNEGYHFVSWNDTNSVDVTKADRVIEVSTNNHYVASFAANSYSVAYYGNGGTNEHGNVQIESGYVYDEGKYLLPADTFTRVGYKCIGWTKNPLSGEKDYDGEAMVSNLTTAVDGMVCLYAVWENTVVVDKTITITTNGDGTAWNKISDTEYQVSLSKNQKSSELNIVINGSGNLSFVVDGTGIENNIQLNNRRDAETPIPLTTNGCYSIMFESSNSHTNSIYTGYAPKNGSFTISNISWTPSEKMDPLVGVTFQIGDNIYTNLTLTTGNKYGPLPMTLAGYSAIKWYDAPDGGNEITSDSIVPSENITLWARGTAINYSITYQDADDCEHANPTNYTVNDEVVFSAPTKMPAGKQFLGWSPATIAKGTTSNITVTAQWDTIKYKVDIDGEVQYSEYGQSISVAAPFASVEDGDRQIVCCGWVGTGDVPVSGTGSPDKFTVTQNSTLKWLYTTNYWVSVIAGDGGSVSIKDATGKNLATNELWVAAGAKLTLVAAANSGYAFEKWRDAYGGSSGATSIGQTAQTEVTINKAWVLKAMFKDAPVEPTPDPDPTEPDPTEPDPTDPDPVTPDPVEPDPVEPDSTLEDNFVATTYDGYLYDAANERDAMGTIQVKAAAPRTKSGVRTTTLTIAIQLAGETKKLSAKGTYDLTTAGVQRFDVKNRGVLKLSLGLTGLTGAFENYKIEAVKNVFVAKDSDSKAKASAANAKYVGAYNVMADEGMFAISVATKGKAKIAGTLANGKKVSVSTQLIVGNDVACVPVIVPKYDLAFTLWIGDKVTVEGLTDAVAGYGTTALASGAMVMLDTAALTNAIGDATYAAYLPNGAAIRQNGTKWIVMPDANGKAMKIGKIVLAKDGSIDAAKSKIDGYNVAALKLTYTAKTGAFKGSFKAYYKDAKGKLKNVTFTITGVMIDGIGYGTATNKKLGTAEVRIADVG